MISFYNSSITTDPGSDIFCPTRLPSKSKEDSRESLFTPFIVGASLIISYVTLTLGEVTRIFGESFSFPSIRGVTFDLPSKLTELRQSVLSSLPTSHQVSIRPLPCMRGDRFTIQSVWVQNLYCWAIKHSCAHVYRECKLFRPQRPYSLFCGPRRELLDLKLIVIIYNLSLQSLTSYYVHDALHGRHDHIIWEVSLCIQDHAFMQ